MILRQWKISILANWVIKPTKNLIRPADSHSSWSMTDKEINPSPEGADLNLQRFNVCVWVFIGERQEEAVAVAVLNSNILFRVKMPLKIRKYYTFLFQSC